MLAGDLRDRLTITTPTVATDTLGGQTTTWAVLAIVWGAFRSLTGREAIQAGAMQASMTHRASIRYRPDITVRMRITRNTTTCDITAVRDPDGRRTWLELDLVEVP